MIKNEIFITKASGKTALFSREKIVTSMLRAGASDTIAETVADKVSKSVRTGMTTKDIYRLAFELLKRESGSVAGRYHLKKAIMELGPSGYPFERFIGSLLHEQGYRVKVGQLVQGRCVTHEVDVIAEKDNHHYMIECKYHNMAGTMSDVKIPLYIQARFEDVKSAWTLLPGHSDKLHQGWVVTNTRFSKDAVRYGECIGLQLLGWDYPERKSLRQLIDKLGLYPVTCFTTLTKTEIRKLLKLDVVLCKEVCSTPDLLNKIGVKASRIDSILEEGRQICHKLVARGKH